MSSCRSFFSIFTPWTCKSCRQQIARAQNLTTLRRTLRTRSVSITPKVKRRRRVLLATSGVTAAVGAGAIAVSDEAKHYAAAIQRTGRVITTLAICVNDYRVTLKHEHDIPEDFQSMLKACHKRCAQRAFVAMEKNGSIFIKLGQHLSSLNYLLPNEWCDTFIPLQDNCPVSSYESIEEMVKHDTGHDLQEYFEEFEEKPIGAASLAQVHIAKIKGTGERVAVKIQHPSLDEWAPLDLALTRFTFATLKRIFPEYDLTWLAEEMEVSLPQELDFHREAQNAIRARNYFAELHNSTLPVVIPRVIWARRRILVMEYITGHRPDDLEYLDSHGINRDEVSAALARIFNQMIFGANAPLHCDPHGGNIAIRHRPSRGLRKNNFDVILYDHGLYRDIPMDLRRGYAKMWLSVLDFDEAGMRKYANEVAGITDDSFPLFASAITGRDYSVLKSEQGVSMPRNQAEKRAISDALSDGLLQQLVQLLGRVPRVLLLILKTNDLTRSLDEGLQTRQGTVRTYLILARYASRTVYEEALESIGGSILWPPNLAMFLMTWLEYKKREIKLTVYETYLDIRRLLGFGPLSI